MRVAIIGANGQVGEQLVRAFGDRNVISLSRINCDLTDRNHIRSALSSARPDLIVVAAAFTDVDRAESNRTLAFAVNALAPRWIATESRRMNAGVVYISTDFIFDGDADHPYDEWSTPNPRSIYGRSKLAGETEIKSHAERWWIIRTSWVYGGPGRNFVNSIRRAAATGASLTVVDDEVGNPTFATDLAIGMRQLIDHDAPGTYHLSNAGECSRLEFARAIVELSGSNSRVEPTTSAKYSEMHPLAARRPPYSSLANNAAAALGVSLRPWREALTEHLCGHQ